MTVTPLPCRIKKVMDVQERMSEWPTFVWDCFRVKDAGANCCVQHLCCGPCVYASALTVADIKHAPLYALLVACRGDSPLDEVAGYAARRQIVEKYGIKEDPANSLIISCACGPCARVQEVNAILVRERHTYGCARIIPDQPTPPRAKVMKRDPSGKAARAAKIARFESGKV